MEIKLMVAWNIRNCMFINYFSFFPCKKTCNLFVVKSSKISGNDSSLLIYLSFLSCDTCRIEP